MKSENDKPKKDNLCDAMLYAESAGNSFRSAYSVFPFSPAAAEFYFNDGLETLRKAAAHLGFTLTPIKAEAEAETCAA